MILREKDDDDQYKEYLKLKYPDKNTEEIFNIIKESRDRLDEEKEDAELLYQTLIKKHAPSVLSAIIFSKNRKLAGVSLFKRYAAYLISEYGYEMAGKLLYKSRTSLWRLVKKRSS